MHCFSESLELLLERSSNFVIYQECHVEQVVNTVTGPRCLGRDVRCDRSEKDGCVELSLVLQRVGD